MVRFVQENIVFILSSFLVIGLIIAAPLLQSASAGVPAASTNAIDISNPPSGVPVTAQTQAAPIASSSSAVPSSAPVAPTAPAAPKPSVRGAGGDEGFGGE